MPLALFDLDHTLAQIDTPALWFSHLIEKGALEKTAVELEIERYTELYHSGNLDYAEYMAFELSPLCQYEREQLLSWREEFQRVHLAPNISAAARTLVNEHRQKGHIPIIITASNYFIAEAAALELDISHLLATDPEMVNGQYNGRFQGVPCFQEGKISKLEQWLEKHGESLVGAWFYSDSINDLPLLEQVDNPVLVNADTALSAIGRERNWPHLDLTGNQPVRLNAA